MYHFSDVVSCHALGFQHGPQTVLEPRLEPRVSEAQCFCFFCKSSSLLIFGCLDFQCQNIPTCHLHPRIGLKKTWSKEESFSSRVC